jgi:hypothetical protein
MTEISQQALKKIEPINTLLESRFGIRVDAGTFEHLIDVREHYDAKRRRFVETMGEAAALATPEYAKCVLITEAVRLLLKEIAPKRARKKK